MKKRRKHKSCLNCGELLHQKHNYCPNCGQENTDHQVSLGMLMREFTSNFFSLDSRFAHTFKPFLFSPGKITNAFIEGKRVYYANPIRWYIVISIFHFFFLAKTIEPSERDKKQRGFGDAKELSIETYDSLFNLPDSVHKGWPLSGERQKMVNHLIETTDLSADAIADSLSIPQESWTDKFVINRIIKISQETTASLNTYLFRQFPMIIFFALPIYAFLLKLFFWRKGLYIKHLIHSIHLHSFLFFTLTIMWVLALFIQDVEDFAIPISLLLIFSYSVISYSKVYKIKIGWSIFRASILGFIYMFFVSFVFLIGVLISLAMI